VIYENGAYSLLLFADKFDFYISLLWSTQLLLWWCNRGRL